tara:strand:- start:13 stop:174 length:162 start_codon:yes stop_codon:yes gene_type:complete
VTKREQHAKVIDKVNSYDFKRWFNREMKLYLARKQRIQDEKLNKITGDTNELR